MPRAPQLFNYAQTFSDSYDKGFERGQRSKLADLVGQAWNAPQEQQGGLLAQIAGINPEAASTLETRAQDNQDRQRTEMLNLARAWKSSAGATPEQRKAFYDGFLVPKAQASGLPLPQSYDEGMLDREADAYIAMGGGQNGLGVQSTFVDAQGNRVAIMRDGTTAVLGQNAPQNQIIDTGNGYYGVNKGNLSAAPVMVGGQPQQSPQGQWAQPGATYQTPQGIVRIDPDIDPADMEAVQADIANGGQADSYQLPPRGAPQGQLAKAPAQITPYQQAQLRMQQQRLEAAQQARDQATAARQAADAAKASQQEQTRNARQAEAANAANQLISAIDTLTGSPGYSDLGTVTGDLKLNTPLIRSGVKDSEAQLKNIAGQVALATMSKLKALSAQGATGFGALSREELRLLENSIATLQSDRISNAQLSASLKTIRDTMEKVSGWQQPAQPAPQQSARPALPSGFSWED